MWTQKEEQELVLHAENAASETLSDYLLAYFSDRLPSPEEIASTLDIPIDDVMMAMAAEESE